jgi:predicted Zn-dependent protease
LDQDYFEVLTRAALGALQTHEHLFMSLYAESSQFLRINAGQVRQVGTVEDATLEFSFVVEAASGERRRSSRSITLTGSEPEDFARIQNAIQALQSQTRDLPVDPFAELPSPSQPSRTERRGKLLNPSESIEAILTRVQCVDLAGIYASGPVVRAMANSAGLRHWFYSESFSLDYSLYTPEKGAVKGTYAGSEWDTAQFSKNIEHSKSQLSYLSLPRKKLARGEYRAYLAPAAVHDLVSILSWGGVGEAAIRQGDSPFRHLRSGEKSFSPKFSLYEDFETGATPRFNAEGELAPERLPIIERGKLINTLISTRTAKEYGIVANGAAEGEGQRTPSVSAGAQSEAQALSLLGTGLYLSNLHYLNWSDNQSGRITGMTRYACFWVENGKVVAPIENMRFDDSIFSLFGTALEELTAERAVIPATMTYIRREVGEMRVPGIWVSKMNFAL